MHMLWHSIPPARLFCVVVVFFYIIVARDAITQGRWASIFPHNFARLQPRSWDIWGTACLLPCNHLMRFHPPRPTMFWIWIPVASVCGVSMVCTRKQIKKQSKQAVLFCFIKMSCWWSEIILCPSKSKPFSFFHLFYSYLWDFYSVISQYLSKRSCLQYLFSLSSVKLHQR